MGKKEDRKSIKNGKSTKKEGSPEVTKNQRTKTRKRTNRKTENPKKNRKSTQKRGATGNHPRPTNQDPKSGRPLLKSPKSQIPLGSRSHGAHARGRARERQATPNRTQTKPNHTKTQIRPLPANLEPSTT